MRHLILLGLALAGLVSHAEHCFIDGSNTPRCLLQDGVPGVHEGESYPVFTADTPEKVWAESKRVYATVNAVAYESPRLDSRDTAIVVKHVRFDVPDNYPDVVCFDFYYKSKASPSGAKRAQTCFDTMEITER